MDTGTYSPLLKDLIAQCVDDWGEPELNRKDLLPYGVSYLDKALYGMDIINGELVLIQGPEKQRKTTFVVNVILNYMTAALPVVKPMTVIDTLESGMNPKRYRDTLIANMATRILMRQGHTHHEYCPACQSDRCLVLGLSPEYLRYNKRKEEQEAAITEAMDVMRDWPIHIYGASLEQGDTRNLMSAAIGTQNYPSRWHRLVEEFGAKVFVSDHLQQYSFDDNLSDYEKQLRTIAATSDVVARDGIVNLLISQVSLGSQKDASSGVGKYTASGGRKASQEATSILSVNYESGSGQMCITIEDSRKSASFSVFQPIEDTSGAFYGEPRAGAKSQYRPGMEDRSSHGKH